MNRPVGAAAVSYSGKHVVASRLDRGVGSPVISQPWTRVRDRVAIPDPVTGAALRAMEQPQFEELVRGHLLPSGEGPERKAWRQLWSTLAGEEHLQERTFEVLDGFLDATEEALAVGLDGAGEVRARKFRAQCLEAWARLARDAGKQPLAWAGAAAASLTVEGRQVVAMLVSAIARHRSAVRRYGAAEDRDRRVWSALGRVGLDPADPHPVQVDHDSSALAWAGPAAERLNPAARAFAAILVSAIAAHRRAAEGQDTPADRRLWHILTVTGLDPLEHGD